MDDGQEDAKVRTECRRLQVRVFTLTDQVAATLHLMKRREFCIRVSLGLCGRWPVLRNPAVMQKILGFIVGDILIFRWHDLEGLRAIRADPVMPYDESHYLSDIFFHETFSLPVYADFLRLRVQRDMLRTMVMALASKLY